MKRGKYFEERGGGRAGEADLKIFERKRTDDKKKARVA